MSKIVSKEKKVKVTYKEVFDCVSAEGCWQAHGKRG